MIFGRLTVGIVGKKFTFHSLFCLFACFILHGHFEWTEEHAAVNSLS
jgi:hypothetical protein